VVVTSQEEFRLSCISIVLWRSMLIRGRVLHCTWREWDEFTRETAHCA
jgi:hypothetical protein